jgi:RNA 2',3'-cyclic 3'-phosphodiesterase
MIRLFVAASFSVPVTRRLADEVEKRKAPVGQSLKVAWVPPANFHLTLKFLGSAPEESVEAIAGRLARVAARHQPFELKARGLGAFPNAEQPSVLWIGADGGEALLKLQKDIEGALVALGFPVEDRAYHPHVTVGRVRERVGVASWTGIEEFGSSTVSEIVVYESRTLSAGAEYIARARIALGKKENV